MGCAVPALDIHSDINKTKVILSNAYVTNPTMLSINVFVKVKITNKVIFSLDKIMSLVYFFILHLFICSFEGTD